MDYLQGTPLMGMRVIGEVQLSTRVYTIEAISNVFRKNRALAIQNGRPLFTTRLHTQCQGPRTIASKAHLQLAAVKGLTVKASHPDSL